MHRAFRPAIAAGALTLLGAAAVGAAPAQAATSTVALTSHVQSVKTSTGKALKFVVTAAKSSATTLTVSMSTAATGTGESHVWSFPLSSSAFTFSPSTGKAVLKTGSQISPYGTFTLTFTKTSQSSKSCSAGSTKTVKGSLKGIAHFVSNTGKSGWGNVGSATKTFSFTTPSFVTVTTGEGCFGGAGGGATTPCTSGISWFAPGGGSTYASGTPAGSSSTISVVRTSKLSKPSKATRSDVLTATGQPIAHEAGGSVHVTTKPGARWSGTATLGEQNGFPYPDSPCTVNGVAHTQHTTSYPQAPWTSPAGDRLKADFRVTPDYLAPTSGNAILTVSSYS